MAGFGFGFGSRKNGARFTALGSGTFLPVVSPAQRWNGSAGSGFEAVPLDPVRSTAKPTLRLIVPPNQYFTDELLVGVMAGANDGGSLVTKMGLDRVEVHFEGTSRTIDAPSFQTFADVNGTYRTYFGWWTLLRHDGRHGHAQVYFEAVPADATMQHRVMGPYQFSPQPSLHDASLTVAVSGGGDFQTIAGALAHCRVNGFDNPLVSITEAGDYDIADGAQPYEGRGYCTIEAALPGVRIAKPGYSTDAAAVMRTRYAGLRFKGADLTIDMRYIAEIYSESGATRFHWLDGCTIRNSAGQGALWRGVTRPANWIVRDGAWFTECAVDSCNDAFRHAKLVRGTTEANGWQDLYSGCPMVVGSVSSGHRADTTLARDLPALTVRYTGAAAAATIELTGGNALATRTVTVKIAGTADHTFAVSKSEAAYQAGANYTLQHLAAWLNTIPSVSATVIDASSGRAAGWLSLAGLSGREFAARDIKAAPLTLVTHVDCQSNWWQADDPGENVIVWGNLATGLVARAFGLDGTGSKRDVLLANNAIQNDKSAAQSATLSSQFDGANSHVVCAHNTLSTQPVTFRTDAAYSSGNFDLFANNSVRAIGWAGAAAATPIINNHVHAGQTAPPSAAGMANVAGTTIGGSDETLYSNDRAGDFSALGALVGNPAVSVLRYDASGGTLATVDVKGAFKASTQQPVTTASSVTQYGITYTFSEPRPVAQYPTTGDYRVLGPVTIVSTNPPSAQVSGAYANNPATYANAWAHGLEVNPGNRSKAPGGSLANNKDNQPTGLNGIPARPGSGYAGVAYNHAFNQDPGATGQPLTVATGSLMKFVSRDGQDGRPAYSETGRPGGTDMAVLTVVDELGPVNALRPGVAQADKSHPFTSDDWDLTVFQNFPIPPNAPTYDSVVAKVKRAYAMQFTNSVDSENAHAGNNHPNYGREISAQQIDPALIYLHLNITAQQKVDLLNALWAIGNDGVQRYLEGGDCQVPAGGGSQWRKPVAVLIYAALRNAVNQAARDAALPFLDGTAKFLWAEDKQIRQVSQPVIDTPRSDDDPDRPYTPYAQWMRGSYDYTSDGRDSQISKGGSNFGAVYRETFCSAIAGGMWSVRWTTGAMAIWNRPGTFSYHDSHWDVALRLGRIQPGSGNINYIPSFAAYVLENHFPPDPVAPAIASVETKGTSLWVRFNKAMDEASVPSLSDLTLKVNGSVVAIAGVAGVFRTNTGLNLNALIPFGSTVTLSYAGGANKLRSAIHKVAVPAFADQPVTVLNESVGGVNAAYPIVQFNGANPDRYKVSSGTGSGQSLGGAGSNSPRFTLWMPHLKLFTLPTSSTLEILGALGGGPTFEVQVLTSGRINIIPRDHTGAILAQMQTTVLAINTVYSIRCDCDVSDPNGSTGWRIFVNGASAKGNSGNWSGAAGKVIGWDRAAVFQLGGTGTSTSLNGEFGGLWLHTSARVTDPAQVARFTSKTNGNLDIGTLGDGITGTMPSIFFVGDAAQYNDPSGINRGVGPKFFRLSGGVVDLDTMQSSQWR